MKKAILFLISNLIIYTNCFTQTSWTNLVYHFQTGTVPPPYFYSYDIKINSNSEGILFYYVSYNIDSPWTYKTSLSQTYMEKLDSAINESKVLTDSIPSLKKHPIGGSIQNLQIFLKQDPNIDQMPKLITTPDFPQPEFKEKLSKLYEVIKSSIPQSVWDDIKSKKESLNQKKN